MREVSKSEFLPCSTKTLHSVNRWFLTTLLVYYSLLGSLAIPCAVMSDSLQLHEQWPTRLLCPWDFTSKNTGMGCHFLPQGSSSSNPGIKLMSPVLAGGFFTTMLPRKPRLDSLLFLKYSQVSLGMYSFLCLGHSFPDTYRDCSLPHLFRPWLKCPFLSEVSPDCAI